MLFVGNLPVYLAVLLAACTTAGYFFWQVYTRKFKSTTTRVRRTHAAPTGGARRRNPNVPLHRRPAARMRTMEEESEDSGRTAEHVDLVQDVADGQQQTETDTANKKVGTKKAAKLAEKERRKEEREAEEKYREHQRKLEDVEIAKRKRQAEDEEQAAAVAEAAEVRRLEEDAAREQAEYEKLKLEFSVECEGTDVVPVGSQIERELNAQLVAAVVKAKIVPIEHLALEFNLKTDVCVDKLKQLLHSGQLTGVLDDRGKFVHITTDEYENVAQFIDRRGRVTLSELVENGHKLLNLSSVGRGRTD